MIQPLTMQVLLKRSLVSKRTSLGVIVLAFLIIAGCQQSIPPENIDLSKAWHFSPDENNIGLTEEWFAINFDDSQWKLLDAGLKWEEQGFPDLDSYAWYRKSVDIPKKWKGRDIWIKFEAVNDAYTLFINGEKISFFGEANISIATRPTFTEISKKLKYGKTNQITLQVNDWGGSGGLWRLPVILTTDEDKVSNFFEPMTQTPYTPEGLGYGFRWLSD